MSGPSGGAGGNRSQGSEDKRGSAKERGRKAAERSLSEEEARRRVTAEAFKLLAARPSSEKQLREWLLAKPWADPDVVDCCIDRLKELGYVNDRLVAHSYASYRVHSKPLGRTRLARELAGKKLSGGAIEEALETVFDEVDEEVLIDRAIEKRIRSHGSPGDRGSARRLFAHLARLGFEYDLIIRKLRALKMSFDE